MVFKMFISFLVSFFTGVVGHLVFYPIIEGWNSKRMRRLARPAIGVMLNSVPFIVHLKVMIDLHQDTRQNQAKIYHYSIMSYFISFLWNGAGVFMGYLLDDWRYKNERN